MHHLPYSKRLKKFSRTLRSDSTLGEVLLWNKLRRRQLGYTFNRQKPLKFFIADFYCRPLNLVIEVDGNSHTLDWVQRRDENKERQLREMGLEILRFTEREIREYMDDVVTEIKMKIEEIEKKDPIVKIRRLGGTRWTPPLP